MAASKQKFVRFGGQLADVIEEYNHGIRDNYDIILQQIGDTATKSSHLREILKQFVEVVHLLDRNHKFMVQKLLQLNWAIREREIIELFHELLLDLATANPIHQSAILNCLVLHFQPVSAIYEWSEPCVPQEEIYQIIHRTMQSIFTLIPLSATIIFQIVVSNFPFIKKQLIITEWYVKNVLFLTTYRSSLRHEVLELIISKTLKLDTLSPRENIEKHTPPEDEMFEMEIAAKSSDLAFVEKLEVCMEILLQYICDICGSGSESEDQAQVLYGELVEVFDGVVLPVHGCSHIQFIMFYICSFRPSFHEAFIAHLWKKVERPNTPVVLRQTSMCYIASLVARAKYIPIKTAMSVLEQIASWIHMYIKEREDDTCVSFVHETVRHGTFYSVCQALFYVIIFKHREILNREKGYRFLQKLHLEHIIMSRLNPLKFCIETVVNLFSSIMRIHQVVYCDSIIERNNRHSIPIHGLSDAANNANPLDSFFPFDPYLLKSSSAFITNIYKEWEGPVPRQDGAKEDAHDVDLFGTSPMSVPKVFEHEQIFKNSFSGKSMSPGFSLVGATQF